eukprot:GHVS01054915.1.p1 GENE.GHVS01054915.1~~GHVS01054915.1.p1  ORF type:complete len:145 (+),score=28.58 GHVS01054915.1:309-743(+)
MDATLLGSLQQPNERNVSRRGRGSSATARRHNGESVGSSTNYQKQQRRTTAAGVPQRRRAAAAATPRPRRPNDNVTNVHNLFRNLSSATSTITNRPRGGGWPSSTSTRPPVTPRRAPRQPAVRRSAVVSDEAPTLYTCNILSNL